MNIKHFCVAMLVGMVGVVGMVGNVYGQLGFGQPLPIVDRIEVKIPVSSVNVYPITCNVPAYVGYCTAFRSLVARNDAAIDAILATNSIFVYDANGNVLFPRPTAPAPAPTPTPTPTPAPAPAPAPDFTVTVTPSQLNVPRGTTGSYSVSLAAVGGFTGTVTLTVTGFEQTFMQFLSGNTVSTFPATKQLQVNVPTGVQLIPRTLTITATDASGRQRTAQVTMNIQ